MSGPFQPLFSNLSFRFKANFPLPAVSIQRCDSCSNPTRHSQSIPCSPHSPISLPSRPILPGHPLHSQISLLSKPLSGVNCTDKSDISQPFSNASPIFPTVRILFISSQALLTSSSIPTARSIRKSKSWSGAHVNRSCLRSFRRLDPASIPFERTPHHDVREP